MNYLSALMLLGNEDVRYARESREHHAAMGVERFNWGVHRVIDDFDPSEMWPEDRVFRTPVNYDGGHDEEVRNLGILKDVINACNDCRWLAILDNDEFLIADRSLPELLSQYEAFEALAVNWLTFGSSGHRTKQESQREAFAWRTRCDFEFNRHIKSIVNPARVLATPHDPHYLGVRTVNENRVAVTGPYSPFTGTHIRMNHYYTRSVEDWLEKQRYCVAPRTQGQFDWINAACIVHDDDPMHIHDYQELAK